jgi:hypothetical protein
MEFVKEQRMCVKYFFRCGKTTAETHTMLIETYVDDALTQQPMNGSKVFRMEELQQMT